MKTPGDLVTGRPRPTLVCALTCLAVLSAAPSAGGSSLGDRSDADCSRAETIRVIRTFLRAYNSGDISEIDRNWSEEPDFQWYFVNDEREEDAEDRITLRSYFVERIALDDHIQLRSLSVNRNGMDFSFTLSRTTDDSRKGAGGLFHGKGQTRPAPGLPSLEEPIPSQQCRLAVWAMDRNTR